MTRDEFRNFIDNYEGELIVDVYGKAYINGLIVAEVKNE